MPKSINNLLAIFGIQIKKTKALSVGRDYLVSMFSGAAKIFNLHKKYENSLLNSQLKGMVFSKDRAMQLHALLSSYIKNVINYSPLHILYKTTNEESKRAYADLQNEFKSYPFHFIPEVYFYSQVKEWLSTEDADRIFFMTDDAIFLDSFDMNCALLFNPLDTILSLTKGYDMTYCFTLDLKQEIPVFTKTIIHDETRLNFWNWNSSPASPGWSYPISVDGDFYFRKEMLVMAEHISFNNPNSFEANLQVFLKLFIEREGVCFDKVKLINIPCNIVQDVIKNRSTYLFTAGELQTLWDKGKRIDIDSFNRLDASTAMHSKYSFIDP